jgi:hypothetical protein
MKPLRDIYHKFLATSKNNQGNYNLSGGDLPYFYIKNDSLVALFKMNDHGEPIVLLNPS